MIRETQDFPMRLWETKSKDSKSNRFVGNSQTFSFERVRFETSTRYTSEENEELVGYMSAIQRSDLDKLMRLEDKPKDVI